MAEVLRALNPDEARRFMPMQEMYEPQQREVYEAAGEHIMTLYELNGCHAEDHGDLLLQLNDGYYVAFSYVMHQSAESIREQG